MLPVNCNHFESVSCEDSPVPACIAPVPSSGCEPVLETQLSTYLPNKGERGLLRAPRSSEDAMMALQGEWGGVGEGMGAAAEGVGGCGGRKGRIRTQGWAFGSEVVAKIFFYTPTRKLDGQRLVQGSMWSLKAQPVAA